MRRSVTIPLFASLGASLLLAACTPQDSPLAETPPRLKGNQVAATGRADQIALGGHGEFFDADMRRIVADRLQQWGERANPSNHQPQAPGDA
jgi:hypothetical protein